MLEYLILSKKYRVFFKQYLYSPLLHFVWYYNWIKLVDVVVIFWVCNTLRFVMSIFLLCYAGELTIKSQYLYIYTGYFSNVLMFIEMIPTSL